MGAWCVLGGLRGGFEGFLLDVMFMMDAYTTRHPAHNPQQQSPQSVQLAFPHFLQDDSDTESFSSGNSGDLYSE